MSLDQPLSLFSLHGRRALVTGASRGLGQAIALGLSQAGAELVITARSLAALEETAAQIRAAGGVVTALALDQADIAGAETVLADIGAIDILVNNAGVEEIHPSEDLPEQLWDRIVDTNLKGAFFVTQAVARGMLARGRGAVINMCSLTSYVGVPTATPYGASKSGLLGMTRALSAEWAGRGVRVNAIAPGYFRTAMTEVFYQNEDWASAMLDKIPQRRFGQGQDLIGAVIFLASDASAYITGQCIGIDGGYLASI
ncbi:glucose 1-dehydrogenase [Xinfangfangia sp. D13-10-4-6]|uniref:glucose 1-dehydrogenase n=1 Tax=Pseudogemmobacter hezensis TaxID=2737662 RepID=UPI0015557FF8|nr:glucose 1-dehydrogenase [Pseudogemmobacter hezensis]NPD16616.1 glucose 1-dehydrogenase [Pseudogemmobacter hezensis]